VAELRGLVERWPSTQGAREAAQWLLEDALVAGRWSRAGYWSARLSEIGAEGGTDVGAEDGPAELLYLRTLAWSRSRGAPSDSLPPGDMPARAALADPWGLLLRWIEARSRLAADPEGEGLRSYLEFEGPAREDGWTSLWLAGFLEAPVGTKGREILDDLLGRAAETDGSTWMTDFLIRAAGPADPSAP